MGPLNQDIPPSEKLCENDVSLQQSQPNRLKHQNIDEDENNHLDSSSQLSLDWAHLPKTVIPPKEEIQPVEKFVTDAILSRHMASDTLSSEDEEKRKAGIVGYRAIIDLLRKRDDKAMLQKVFIALLRTSAIEKMCSDRSVHKRLIHFIFRTSPPTMSVGDAINKGKNIMAEQETKEASVEDNYVDSKKVLFTDDMFDTTIAFLNFIVALISANSVFLQPTLNTLWRLLQNVDAVTPYDHELTLSSIFEPEGEDIDEEDKKDKKKKKKTKDDGKMAQSNFFFRDDKEREIWTQHQIKLNSLLHGTLRKVLDLVPSGKSEIFNVVASSFPFKNAPLQRQLNYVKQSFLLLRYVPIMERQLLELIVDKCLGMDVEIRIANNGDVKIEEVKKDDDEDGIVAGQDTILSTGDSDNTTMMEVEDERKENNAPSNHNKQKKPLPTDKEIKLREEMLEKQKEKDEIDELAGKLDELMYKLFEHLQFMTKSKQRTPRQYFKMLLPTFESAILTTHRCKFVQFLMIHLCGLDNDHTMNQGESLDQPQLCREFAAKLIDIVLDPYRPTVTRQSAACYLASFVSRTACVCAETACEATAALLRFAQVYMDTFPTEESARNARRYLGFESNGEEKNQVSAHCLFFTVCQAAFYIMCFRGKECVEYYEEAVEYHKSLVMNQDEDDIMLEHEYSDLKLIDISPTQWEKVCTYHLNPLKYCLESVRGEFLYLADSFHLLDKLLLERLFLEDIKWSSCGKGRNESSSSDGSKKSKKRKRKPTLIKSAATMAKRRFVGGVGGLGKGSNPLDSFFPFDPYLLRRSYAFVDPHYRHWDGRANQRDDSSNESQGGSEEASQTLSIDKVEHGNDDESHQHCDDELEEENNDFVDFDDDKENDDIDDAPTAMSVTSATTSMGGSEWTDDLTDTEVTATAMDTGNDKTNWVNELKRARALSIGDDCW